MPTGRTIQRTTGTANAISEVKITPPMGKVVELTSIHFSYSAAPTGGVLSVVERNPGDSADASTLYSIDVTGGGTGPMELPDRITAPTAGSKVAIRMSAGGSGITGSLNVWYECIPTSVLA